MRLIHGGALASIIVLAACSGGTPASDEDRAPVNQSAQIADAAENAVAAPAEPAANASPAVIEDTGPSAKAEVGPESKVPEKPEAVLPKKTEVAAAAPAAVPEPAKVAVEPPKTFARCAVCHTANKGGEDKLGPNLFGVVGAKAGHHRPGFQYSDALKGSGLSWDEATLDKWIAKPMTLVPGTIMSFPGISDPAKRQELIDYLKTLK